MSEVNKNIDEMIKNLKQERDELRVKVHLAKMEVVEEWDKIEVKMAKLETKAKELGGATKEASKDIGAAAKLLGEEIRNAYKKIARHF